MNNTKEEMLEELKGLISGMDRVNATIYGASFGGKSPAATPVTDLPIYRKFSALYDYAMHGQWDEMGGLYRIGEIIPEALAFIDVVETFTDRGLLHFDLREPALCRRVAETANAKLKLDKEFSDSGWELTIQQMAQISGLTEHHLRNEVTKGSLPTIKRDGRVYVKAATAIAWLESRGYKTLNCRSDSVAELKPGFVASNLDEFKDFVEEHSETKGWPPAKIPRALRLWDDPPGCLQFTEQQWKESARELDFNPYWLAATVLAFDLDDIQDDPFELERRRTIVWNLAKEFRGGDGKEMIEVPVARDGSWFHPGLKRRQGYQIGPKGKEKYVDDYFDALNQMRKMHAPYWRRPSKTTGVPGIVTATSWRSVSLESLAQALRDSGASQAERRE